MNHSEAVGKLDLGTPEPSLQGKVAHAKALVDASAPAEAAAKALAEEREEFKKTIVDGGGRVLDVTTHSAVAEAAEAKTYAAPRLAMVLRKYRVITEIEPADFAKQVGITTRQLGSFEQGKDCGSDVLARILSWVLGAA